MTIELYREFFYVTVAVILLIAASITFISILNKRVESRLTTYALHINTVMDGSIPTVLDEFIEECQTQYLVLNPTLANLDYIKEDKEREIQKGILTLVMERISPALLDKLSLYYNTASINDIITEKVVISITGYVVEHNRIKN